MSGYRCQRKEIAPLAPDSDVGFICVPLRLGCAAAFAPRALGQEGAKRASQPRMVSWLKTNPRSKHISAGSRRLNVYRNRRSTTRKTMSVGTVRWLSGVPVRSLQARRQLARQKRRWPRLVRPPLLRDGARVAVRTGRGRLLAASAGRSIPAPASRPQSVASHLTQPMVQQLALARGRLVATAGIGAAPAPVQRA